MSEPRIAHVMEDLLRAVGELVEKHRITHAEYRAAVQFLNETAAAGEVPLLCDAFLEANVVDIDTRAWRGTPTNVLGPYYLEGAPLIEDGRLAPKDEPGERLTIAGTVRDIDGSALPGALLDFWQADADGRYGGFGAEPQMNLRGRLHSREDGTYAVDTILPAPYPIPHDGPTGRLLQAVGRHPWRPAHVHLKASHAGHRSLITQIYFAGGAYLDSDSVRAVREGLVRPLQSSSAGHRVNFDVVLERDA